jgi:hypothetical protein
MPRTELRLAMLVARFSFHVDYRADMFGFWYYRNELPLSATDQRGFFMDLMSERCSQVEVHGAVNQIAQILLSAGQTNKWIASSGASMPHNRMPHKSIEETVNVTYAQVAQAQLDITAVLEDLIQPLGGSLPVDVNVSVLEAQDFILSELRRHADSIELHLHPLWYS